MIKKIVVFSIISLFLMMNFTSLSCLSEQKTAPNICAINASCQDTSHSISEFNRGDPPLPPVMWTEDFSTFFIPTPQNPNGDEVRYHIDWGDGTSETTIYYSPGETAIISHVWNEEGTYEIKAQADGQEGTSKWAVYILTLTSYSKFFRLKIGYIDITYTFTIYWAMVNEYYFMVDWGDGETTDWLGPYEQPIIFSHSWDLPGDYEIKMKMKDIWGNESDWFTCTVTILTLENNAPYKPNITGKWIVVFVLLECNFSAVDPDSDDVRYHIDWDDGVNDLTDYFKSGEAVTVSHVYPEKGDFTITAYAEDIHGAIGPVNTFNPRSKTKTVNFDLFFLKLLERFPLLSRIATYIF